MEDVNDYARIPYVLANYDSVEISKTPKRGDVETAPRYRDFYGRSFTKIVYTKRINGTMYVVEAVGDSEHKKIWLVSAFIKKNKTNQNQSAKEESRSNKK
jgi:hypothetical protein